MLKLVKSSEDLVQATVDEIISFNTRDFSRLSVVTPSKRMLFFIKDRLNSHLKGSYFPPELVTIDQFVFRLFNLNHSGFRMANEMEAVLAIFRTINRGFKDTVYTGGKINPHFPDFFPWALLILKAVEELLIEGEFTDRINREIFQEFTQLGEYHQSYKDFIGKMPLLVEQYKDLLLENKQYSRGVAYKLTASLAEAEALRVPAGQEIVFSGLGALNACEEKILKLIFKTGKARILVRCDPGALHEQTSPFVLVARMLESLNLEPGPDQVKDLEWNRLSGKVNLYCLPNLETQMIQVVEIMKAIVADCNQPDDLKKIAVVLPDSASLIPFIHGVVSRFSQQQERVPFNISLGYPFRRTPLYQLLIFMMKAAESCNEEGNVFSPDYLNLIRHPYIKLSGNIGNEEEPLKRGIHLIEDLINRENLLYFRPENVEDQISRILAESEEFSPDLKRDIIAEVKNLHATFLADGTALLPELAEFLKQAVLAVGKYKKHHLFLEDYVNTAVNTLDQVIGFCREHESDVGQTDFGSMVSLLSYHFSGVHIYFEGSPLKGVQVMGMLESRGLSFDEVIVVDALEGVLPQSFKYDPLLPYDIRRAFGVRCYSQWEILFAYNFFSLLGSAKKAHILWIDNQEGTEKAEKSRFIERIIYEIEKQGQAAPTIIRKNCKCELPSEELKNVKKNDSIMAKIKKMNFSASALESYVRCPLRFYFSYIVGIEERKELSPDPDTGELGTVVHRVLERFYRNGHFPEEFSQLEGQLERMLGEEFSNKGFVGASGIGKIRCWVMVEKLKDFLATDIQRLRKNGIEITGLEKKVFMEMDLPFSTSLIKLKGRIDRIETERGLIRLIDYKTGTPFEPRIRKKAVDFRLKDLSNLEKPELLTALKEFRYFYESFQLLMYTLMMKPQTDDYSRIDAAYIFLKPAEDFFRPVFVRGSRPEMISIEEKNILMRNFKHNLTEIMADIFLRKTFVANHHNPQYCGYCPFRVACGNI